MGGSGDDTLVTLSQLLFQFTDLKEEWNKMAKVNCYIRV